MIPALTIVSKEKAAHLLCANASAYEYIISIGDPDEDRPSCYQLFSRPRLRLEFDDVTHDWPQGGRFAATVEQVSRLIVFCKEVDGPTLIHCGAGISRSSAAGCILAAIKLGPGRERAAIDHIAQLSSNFWPNYHVVELADKLLGRDRRLIATLAEKFGMKKRS